MKLRANGAAQAWSPALEGTTLAPSAGEARSISRVKGGGGGAGLPVKLGQDGPGWGEQGQPQGQQLRRLGRWGAGWTWAEERGSGPSRDIGCISGQSGRPGGRPAGCAPRTACGLRVGVGGRVGRPDWRQVRSCSSPEGPEALCSCLEEPDPGQFPEQTPRQHWAAASASWVHAEAALGRAPVSRAGACLPLRGRLRPEHTGAGAPACRAPHATSGKITAGTSTPSTKLLIYSCRC